MQTYTWKCGNDCRKLLVIFFAVISKYTEICQKVFWLHLCKRTLSILFRAYRQKYVGSKLTVIISPVFKNTLQLQPCLFCLFSRCEDCFIWEQTLHKKIEKNSSYFRRLLNYETTYEICLWRRYLNIYRHSNGFHIYYFAACSVYCCCVIIFLVNK